MTDRAAGETGAGPVEISECADADLPVLDEVRRRGGARVLIGVGADNPDAARLYLRLGYADTGTRCVSTYSYFDAAGTEHSATEHVRVLARDLS